MNSPSDLNNRIFSAADALYEEGGRESFPTVDAVRKRARVNMNDASNGMKAWRRSQIRIDEKAAVQLPENIRASSASLVSALWSEAVELASESLRAAQAGWTAEREEADILSEQMAVAFETQASELADAVASHTRLAAELAVKAKEASQMQLDHETALQELHAQRTRAELAEARAVEIERRVADLHEELRHARAAADTSRQEAGAHKLSYESAIATCHVEIAEVKQQAQNEAKTAFQLLSEAKEINALLLGRLSAVEQSVAQDNASGTMKFANEGKANPISQQAPTFF